MIQLIFNTLNAPGERQFMVDLYNGYRRLMFSTVREFFSDRETQEDVLQAALIKLMDKVDTLRKLEKRALVKYIETTVKRTAINELNKAENRRVQIGLPNDYCAGEDLPTEERINLMYNRDMLVLVWSKLSKEDRILLESKYILGNSDKEIAEFLNCKAGSIRMKLTRARRNAITLMEENDYDET